MSKPKHSPKEVVNEWVWMPHAGHFIMAERCRFHLNTYVNGYIVSTVGELFHDEPIREIVARSRGIELEGQGDARVADYMRKIGFDEIGHNRLYETMVFPAKRRKDSCCPYVASDWSGVDFEGYNTAVDAYKGHMKLCWKYAGAAPSE